jgi:hypothetical protein
LEGDPLVIDLGTSALMGTDLSSGSASASRCPRRGDRRAGRPDGRGRRAAGRSCRSAGTRVTRWRSRYALGVLCEGRPTRSAGYLFIAFKPDLFLPLEAYRRALAAKSSLKATPGQEGVDEIRIPGERAYRGRIPRAASRLTAHRRAAPARGGRRGA